MITRETKQKVLNQLNDMVNELDVNIHIKAKSTKEEIELFDSILEVFYKVNKIQTANNG